MLGHQPLAYSEEENSKEEYSGRLKNQNRVISAIAEYTAKNPYEADFVKLVALQEASVRNYNGERRVTNLLAFKIEKKLYEALRILDPNIKKYENESDLIIGAFDVELDFTKGKKDVEYSNLMKKIFEYGQEKMTDSKEYVFPSSKIGVIPAQNIIAQPGFIRRITGDNKPLTLGQFLEDTESVGLQVKGGHNYPIITQQKVKKTINEEEKTFTESRVQMTLMNI